MPADRIEWHVLSLPLPLLVYYSTGMHRIEATIVTLHSKPNLATLPPSPHPFLVTPTVVPM